jgi:uncharacterized membrane protein/mono/diheme cytochrome c family protein
MNVFSKLASIVFLLILVGLSFVDGSSLNLSSNWIPFLGRFHPVLLHLPIGIFAGVVLLELYAFARPVSRVPEKIHFLLTAAFYSTVVTAFFGIFLSWEGGYATDALNLHKWGGIATAAAILVLGWLLNGRRARPEKSSITYLAALAITVGVISATGHFGGSLTHGSGFLTQFNPFANEAEPAENTKETSVYVSHIQPIFQDYCIQCHSPEKVKGELRLDTFKMMMAGGVNGPAIIPGDSESSNMIHAIHLPLDTDEHMPPQGKPQPSEDIVQLLSWWIDQGASETARQEDLEVTSGIAIHFLKIDVLELQTREEIEPHLTALKNQSDLSLNFLAQNDQRIGARGKNASDKDLVSLLPMMSNIVELNLGGSDVTDAGLETVGQMTNLTHLHLNGTAITDLGIERLANLYQLEYINLFGTTITDNALLVLRRLKSLKKVFIWETNATEEAIEALHKSIFPAVESDKIRLQILELSKKRDSLEVDIVSGFGIDLQTPDEEMEAVDEPEITISDVMINFHKGKSSVAAQAQEGKADKDNLQDMLKHYQAIAELTPPKGTLAGWKKRTTELIDATNNLILLGGPEAVDRYKTAVSCKACHGDHRDD